MSARACILRRRAALMAMSGIAATVASSSAIAEEGIPQYAATEAERTALTRAHALQQVGDAEGALAVLAATEGASVESLLLRARLLHGLQRWVEARAMFMRVHGRIEDPDRSLLVEQALDDLRQRTAELVLNITASRPIALMLDGVAIAPPASAVLYVDPGRHTVHAEVDGRPIDHTVELAGGASVTLDFEGAPPHVCLSMMPPDPSGDRGGLHFGFGGASHVLINTVRDGGAVFVGASLNPFVSVGIHPWQFQMGPTGGVFGSSRGPGVLGGLRIESRVFLLPVLGVGVGACAGYLYLDEAREPAELKGVPGAHTTSSFFVIPEVAVTLAMGPLEVGPRVGVLLSRAERGFEGTFGPTYVSTALWVSYVHPND